MRHDAFLYMRMQAALLSILFPFCWSLCTCYGTTTVLVVVWYVVKQENYILLSLIKTCTQGKGRKTNTVATTTISYKNQTLLNIKYNTWMRILHERYVYSLLESFFKNNYVKTLQCLFEDYSIWSPLLILILNSRNCMVERDESTADHSDIHEVPKVPHESSWMKHKSQIHHLK